MATAAKEEILRARRMVEEQPVAPPESLAEAVRQRAMDEIRDAESLGEMVAVALAAWASYFIVKD